MWAVGSHFQDKELVVDISTSPGRVFMALFAFLVVGVFGVAIAAAIVRSLGSRARTFLDVLAVLLVIALAIWYAWPAFQELFFD